MREAEEKREETNCNRRREEKPDRENKVKDVDPVNEADNGSLVVEDREGENLVLDQGVEGDGQGVCSPACNDRVNLLNKL